jgi:hypothetical protein
MSDLICFAHVSALIFISLSALITAGNVYIVFIEPFLYWLRGEKRKFVSAIPGVGNIFLILAGPLLAVEPHLPHQTIIAIFCLVLVILDVGGFPWFAAIMLIQWLRGEKMWSKPPPTPPINRAD